MFHQNRTEVLVVGAGPVGLLTALSLSCRGVDVEIVDGQWRTAARSYALALHPGTLELLAEAELADLGLVQDLIERGHRIDTLAFHEGHEQCAQLDFSRLPGRYPYVLVVPQRDLEDVLGRALVKRGVEVRWNHRVADLRKDGRGSRVTIEKLSQGTTGEAGGPQTREVSQTLTTRANFVIGADGYLSTVRRALDIDFEAVGDSQLFAIFEFDSQIERAREQRVVLGETTNVLWPMGGERARWSFSLEDTWEFLPNTRTKNRLSTLLGDQTFPFLGRELLQRLLKERAPWFQVPSSPADSEIRWSIPVRFDQRLARGFGRGTTWLVGDAAHLASPVGAHSMNFGLREGNNLASRIADIQRRGAALQLLVDLAETRRSDWLQMQAGAFPARPGTSDWVRCNMARIVSCIPACGDDLKLLLEQIGLNTGLKAA